MHLQSDIQQSCQPKSYIWHAVTPKLYKTSSFRDSAMETASVDTAYQPSSSQYPNSVSPSGSSQRPRRRSTAGPAPISIDIPPTPSIPSASSSYDSAQYATHAECPPAQTSDSNAKATTSQLTTAQQPAELQATTSIPQQQQQPAAANQQPTTPHLTSAVQPRQLEASSQSPLGGVLGQLGGQAGDPSTAASEDLLSWLDLKDRQVALPLLGGIAPAARQASIASDEPGAMFKHQEAAEVYPLLAHSLTVKTQSTTCMHSCLLMLSAAYSAKSCPLFGTSAQA